VHANSARKVLTILLRLELKPQEWTPVIVEAKAAISKRGFSFPQEFDEISRQPEGRPCHAVTCALAPPSPLILDDPPSEGDFRSPENVANASASQFQFMLIRFQNLGELWAPHRLE
jgi:hypothetical protein